MLRLGLKIWMRRMQIADVEFAGKAEEEFMENDGFSRTQQKHRTGPGAVADTVFNGRGKKEGIRRRVAQDVHMQNRSIRLRPQIQGSVDQSIHEDVSTLPIPFIKAAMGTMRRKEAMSSRNSLRQHGIHIPLPQP